MTKVFSYGLLITIVCCIALGQILFKRAAIALKTYDSFFQLFFDASFMAALVIYGLATLGWVWVLQNFELNKAYPFFALSFVFVPILSFLIFKESLSWQYAIGVAMICGGILTIVMKA